MITKENRDPRIVFLDCVEYHNFSTKLLEQASFVILGEDRIPRSAWSKPTQEKVVRIIVDYAQRTPCDLIILGNNSGGGLEVANLLSKEECEKTVVVAYESDTVYEKGYKDLGIKYFLRREEVPDLLEGFIEEHLNPTRAVV